MEATDRLKLAHTADTARGATWMAEQLRELGHAGYVVTSIIPEKGDLSKKLEAFNVDYELRKIGFPWHSRQALPALRNIFALACHFYSKRYQVVHHHLYPSMVASRIAAWIADVPVRLSMIPGPFYMDAEIPRAVELCSCWMDTKVIVSCGYSRQQYLDAGVPEKNLELVYYGADEKVFSPHSVDAASARKALLKELDLDEDSELVGMVAYFYSPLTESRHYPESVWNKSIKGHETLIEAIPEILSHCPNARFLFIGDGWGDSGVKLMRDLQSRVAELGLTEFVRFLGRREAIPEILSTLSVSLQLSRSENLGGTIESLLMAKPLIATKIGGMVDSVRHEQTGLLVDVDDVGGLASSVCRLLNEVDFACKLGEAGRALMLSEFSLSHTVRNLSEIYERCYKERDHAAYRLPVCTLRALFAPLVFAGILALQFRYEFEGKAGAYFNAVYEPVISFQSRLASLVKPLFHRSGNVSFLPLAGFLIGLVPVIHFWLTHGIVVRVRRAKDNLLHRVSATVRPGINLMSLAGLADGFRSVGALLVQFVAELLEPRSLRRVAKRFFDTYLAFLLLILCSPFLAAFCILAKVEKRPVFERHTVLGRRNLPFEAYLLYLGTDANGILSRFAWMPLLINIFIGEMSFVGTRIRPTGRLPESPENHPTSWTSCPGLTGWCQLNMKDTHGFEALNALDILYMVQWSPLLDVKLAIKTLVCMFKSGADLPFLSGKYWQNPNHRISALPVQELDLVTV